MAKIYNQGNHTYSRLIEEYRVSNVALRSWVTRYNNSKSFDINDTQNRRRKRINQTSKRKSTAKNGK